MVAEVLLFVAFAVAAAMHVFGSVVTLGLRVRIVRRYEIDTRALIASTLALNLGILGVVVTLWPGWQITAWWIVLPIATYCVGGYGVILINRQFSEKIKHHNALTRRRTTPNIDLDQPTS